METNERLKLLVSRLTGGNQREFARKCGLQPATVCRLINGSYSMSEKYINKICEGYPSVNADYLRGLSDAPVYDDLSAEKAKDDEIARLKHENEVLRWVIQQFGNQGV